MRYLVQIEFSKNLAMTCLYFHKTATQPLPVGVSKVLPLNFLFFGTVFALNNKRHDID